MLVVAVVAVRAGDDARQADDLPPAKRRSRGAIFLANGVVILFAVQPAILADRISQQQVEQGFDGVGEEIRKRVGTVDVAVEFVRDARDR